MKLWPFVLVVGCASTGPTASTGEPEGQEVAHEGSSTVTVIGPGAEPAASASAELSDAQCRAQEACANRGACTAKNGTCVAASWEDCGSVAGCANGRCRFADGACTPVNDCREAFVCGEEGRCQSGSDGSCVANDNESCGASGLCAREGLCAPNGGRCVATPQTCPKSVACKGGGRCSLVDGACAAHSDKDCEKSFGCTEKKQCLARDGVCVKSCAESDGCRVGGRCSERAAVKGQPGSCIAASEDECKKSEQCGESGLCSLGLAGNCVAGDDVECRRARACKEQGRCTFQKERCVPASEPECAQATIACKIEGRCRFQEGRCVK